MNIVLRNKGMYMVTMGRELKTQQLNENSKYLNNLDEAFGFMCIHISSELLFHIDGMETPKEVWEKLESLSGKQDEMMGHILENEMIALQPNNFETIHQLFSKFKSLVMQCKQCRIDKNYCIVLMLLGCSVISSFSRIWPLNSAYFPNKDLIFSHTLFLVFNP